MNIFQILLIAPITNALIVFYHLFNYLHIPGALGFAIITLTTLIRFSVNPMMKGQIEQSKKMQELQPLLTKLQKKYKNDPVKLQTAHTALYKEKKLNPASGCLVLIIQVPLFLGFYNALSQVVTTTSGMEKTIAHINSLLYSPLLQLQSLDVNFFGLQINALPNAWQKIGWWYLLVPIITGALQLYQSYLTTKTMPQIKTPNPNTQIPTKSQIQNSKKKTEAKTDEPDFNAIMQKEMMILFPVMIGWAAYNFPVGLAFYWNIFTIFGIFQYLEIIKSQKVEPPRG